jgi:endonuclease YncB( thermonuclease family)
MTLGSFPHFLMRRFCTVLLSMLLILRPSVLHAKVIISELMWMGTDISTSDEWLELASTSDQLLTGWTITSVKDGVEEIIVRFATGSSILPGSPIVVARWDEGRSRLAAAPGLIVPNLTLPNTKLLLRLRDAVGTLIDEVDDGIGNPMGGANPSGAGSKASMERIAFDVSGNQPSSWRAAVETLGFDAGAPIFGTPGSTSFPPPQPPADAEDLHAIVFSGSLLASWVPAESSLGSHQLLSVFPSVGSGSWTLPATQTGFVLRGAIIATGSVLRLQTVNETGMLSNGVETTIIAEPRLRISEVSLSSASGSGAWIEIENTGGQQTDLAAFQFSIGGRLVPVGGNTEEVLVEPESFIALDIPDGISANDDDVSLLFADTAIDQIALTDVPLGVSIGLSQSGSLVPLCTQTPGESNQQVPLQGRIVVLSGTPPFTVGSPLGVRFDPLSGSMAEAVCSWDFDGDSRDSLCTPGLYTLSHTGTVFVSFEATNYCGTTVTQGLALEVITGQAAVPPPPPLGGGSGGASQAYPRVILSGALPNPVGKDTEGEWVEIENADSLPAQMSGWWLASGKTKHTFGSITVQSGNVHRLMLSGTKLVLGNTNGSVELHSPDGVLVSKAQWNSAYEGRVYRPAFFGSSVIQADVLRVIDGDTFTAKISNSALMLGKDITVRMLGIDTPELKTNTPAYYDAIKAKEFTTALIEGKKVELQFDTEEQDAYDRYLAYVRAPDGTSLQQSLLENGWAVVYKSAVFKKKTEYEAYQKQAQAKHVGMWANGEDAAAKFESASSKSSSAMTQDTEKSTSEKLLINRAEIHISELHSAISNTKSDQDIFLKSEWVELVNPSHDQVDISGWKLTEAVSKKSYEIPANTVIGSGSYLTVGLKASSMHLRDAGGILELRTPEGDLMHQVLYPTLKGATSFAYDQASAQFCITSSITAGQQNICASAEPVATKKSATRGAAKTLKKAATPKKTIAKKASTVAGDFFVPDDQQLGECHIR